MCAPHLSLFTGASVDGKAIVKGTDYAVASGSTVLTLTDEFLRTLEPGTHTLEFQFDGGKTVEAEFNVEKIPATGDATPVATMAATAMVAAAAAGIALARRRMQR